MKDKLTFDAAAISEMEYDWLIKFAKENQIKTVLEFGLGASTYAFLEAGCDVTTFETNQSYSGKFSDLPFACNVRIYKKENTLKEKLGRRFDLAFIDGPLGEKNYSRFLACLFCTRYSDHLLLHDYRRVGEQETFNYIAGEMPEWKVDVINTSRKMGYLHKGSKYNCLEDFWK